MTRWLRLAAVVGLLLGASVALAQDSAGVDELRVLEELAGARTRYGERHPDVVALRARAEVLEGAREAPAERERVCAHLAARARILAADDAGFATRYGERHPARVANRARRELVDAQARALCAPTEG